MDLKIDLTKFKEHNIYKLPKCFEGKNNKEKISFTNYYMCIDDIPFVGAVGECHFSRLSEKRWEEEIIKMKECGLKVISTYLFWNHHEEIEGRFDFTGRRNVRRFVELCKKHELKVIIRVGPFCHGEVRNGGLPDWLYFKPFNVRCTDVGFLKYVKRLFKKYSDQLRGLFFKDGGPIIAVQVDNEYMHSTAPWEMNQGTTNDWVKNGNDGLVYMNALKDIMKEVGLVGAFYTATSWGGAIVPDDVMPLWGGYAYRPWIFYSYKGEHPATTEYVYQDFHNDNVKFTNDFTPNECSVDSSLN